MQVARPCNRLPDWKTPVLNVGIRQLKVSCDSTTLLISGKVAEKASEKCFIMLKSTFFEKKWGKVGKCGEKIVTLRKLPQNVSNDTGFALRGKGDETWEVNY